MAGHSSSMRSSVSAVIVSSSYRADHPLRVHLVDVCAGAHDNVTNDNLDHRGSRAHRGPCASRTLRGGIGPSVTTPGEELRGMNADPMGDRRDACAGLQCLCHRLRLELIRPAPAKLPRRTLKAVGNSFDHMEGSSSRTRRRHRSSLRLTTCATDIRPLPPYARWGLLAAHAHNVRYRYLTRQPTR